MRHYVEEFEAFWKAYPPRPGNPKAAARAQWVRLGNLGALPPLETILTAVKAYAAHVRREKIGLEFVAHARTWLSQRRWEDWAPYADTPLFAPTPAQKVDLPAVLAPWRDKYGEKWWSERFYECQFADDGKVIRVRVAHAYQVERVANYVDISLSRHVPDRDFEISFEGTARSV